MHLLRSTVNSDLIKCVSADVSLSLGSHLPDILVDHLPQAERGVHWEGSG